MAQKRIPVHQRLVYWLLGLSAAIAPVTFTAYAFLNPLLRGTGAEMIVANATANPLTNNLHLVFGVITGFLLPIGAIGFAVLAYRRAPRLATIGGVLGFLGWLPWLALIAQEAMTLEMAKLGGGERYAALWDAFNVSGVMSFYLIFYVLTHLIGVVVLAWAMRRARMVPRWSAWTLGLTSPLTMLAFPLNGIFPQYGMAGFGLVSLLLIVGSQLPALQLLRLAKTTPRVY